MDEPQQQQGASIEAQVAGQRVAVRGLRDPNTLFTVLTFVGIVILGVWQYGHMQDARDAASGFLAAVKEQTAALKDQTAAQREQNCLLRFEQKDRTQNVVEWCKSISGSR